jgi:putative NADH-flavin reductase
MGSTCRCASRRATCWTRVRWHRPYPGHDAVIFAVGATLGALKENPQIFSAGTKNTIELMTTAGVKRLAVLISHGSGDSRAYGAYGGFLLNRIVRPTNLDWVIVRPTLLTNGKATGKYKIVEQPGAPGMRISRSDVADFMVSAVETGNYVKKAISIG